jgi:protein-disulfide isomerase
VDKNSSGTPLLIASLILGASVVAASLLIQSSLDRGTAELSKVLVAINEARPAAPAAPAAAAARAGRPDPNKHYAINTKGSPRRGPEKAQLDLVEFSDFQCPFCSRVNPTLNQINKEYGDQVAIVFKHLPLRMHSKAPAAHAAAEAAHRQGKFWEMHDLIFANQRELTQQKYEEYAQKLGLDMDRFRKDAASPAVKKKVDADAAEAARLGVTGTPGFFVNGRFVSGAKPFESFKQLIDEELKKKS